MTNDTFPRPETELPASLQSHIARNALALATACKEITKLLTEQDAVLLPRLWDALNDANGADGRDASELLYRFGQGPLLDTMLEVLHGDVEARAEAVAHSDAIVATILTS